jgi:DNA-binding response OmpR family regulator
MVSESRGWSGRVLVVEDEEPLALGVVDAIRHAGHEAEAVFDGPAALRALQSGRYDLVVLDLMLPKLSGLDVLQRLRATDQETRVLILSALSREEDLVRGLQLGADDYMPKPFSARELVARIEAQFRRRLADTPYPHRLDVGGGVEIDLLRLEVRRGNAVLSLTPREGDILGYLLRHKDRVVTREDLLTEVWQYRNAQVETRTVDIHIAGLRRKIEPDSDGPILIQTVRGKGYRWSGR